MEADNLHSTTVQCLVFFLIVLQGCHSQSQNQGPPRITVQPSKAVFYIHDDKQELYLPCNATGAPPLRYLWKENGRSSEKLTVKGALIVNETGHYECFVENEFGTAVSRTTEVKRAELDHFNDYDAQTEFSVAATYPLVLPCSAPSGDPAPLVFWSKGDQYVFTNRTRELSWDRERSLALDGDNNLVFLSASMEDAGEYQCEAMSPEIDTYKLLSVKKEVVVTNAAGEFPTRPPNILEGRSEIKALRGQDIKMYCLATGNPLPTVRWVKRGDPAFEGEGPALRLRDVQLEHAGVYTCIASSDGYHPVNQTRVLNVEAAPYWITPPSDTYVTQGGSGVISCEAGGKPSPTIRWMENGELNPDYDNQTSISVNDVTEEDVKVYQCLATNSHGHIVANAILNVPGPKPSQVTSRVLSSTSVLISWRPIDNPHLIEFKVVYRRRGGQYGERVERCGLSASCQLNGLRRNTSFQYKVIAVYDSGEVPSREKIFDTNTQDDTTYELGTTGPRLWRTVMIASGFVLVLGVATPVIMCVVLCIRDQINGIEVIELPTESDAWGRGRPKPKVDKTKKAGPVLLGDGDARRPQDAESGLKK